MDKQSILAEYISKELAIGRKEPIGANEDLFARGVLDSLGVMRLVLFIEETFNLKVPDQDLVLENFKDVNTIARYLESPETTPGGERSDD